MPGTTMREVLLHGGIDEAFDRSVGFARRLAESFGARLHVLYTVEDPLAAGWTAEVSADRMPEIHEAMETKRASAWLASFPRGPGAPWHPDRAPARSSRRGSRPLRQRTRHRPGHRAGAGGQRRRRARALLDGAMRGARAALIPSEQLLAAYASGWFPMAVEAGTIRWFSPDPRGIIPLDAVPRPARLARTCARRRFEIAIDAASPTSCARAPTAGATPTTPAPGSPRRSSRATCAARAGLRPFGRGVATGRLVGGLYGVALGGAFFGESMFHRDTDASKIALVALVDRLRGRGFSCSTRSG